MIIQRIKYSNVDTSEGKLRDSPQKFDTNYASAINAAKIRKCCWLLEPGSAHEQKIVDPRFAYSCENGMSIWP